MARYGSTRWGLLVILTDMDNHILRFFRGNNPLNHITIQIKHYNEVNMTQIVIIVTLRADGSILGREKVNQHGHWTYNLTGRSEWLLGTIPVKEPVIREVK